MDFHSFVSLLWIWFKGESVYRASSRVNLKRGVSHLRNARLNEPNLYILRKRPQKECLEILYPLSLAIFDIK